MNKIIALLLCVVLTATANAAVERLPGFIRYDGTGTNSADILFSVGQEIGANDSCFLMSVTGAVYVEVTLDGTNWATAPFSLQNFGGTTTDMVLVTTAGTVYGFVTKFKGVRVRQSGATASSASLNCWAQGKTG